MTERLSTIKKENIRHGNSLGVQWLRIRTFPTEDVGSIPDWGAKISQAERHGKKQTHKYLTIIYYISEANKITNDLST